jgi:hypothetical protein
MRWSRGGRADSGSSHQQHSLVKKTIRRLDLFLRETLSGMTTDKKARPWLRLCTGVLAGGGVALSTLGLASGIAQAAPAPAPMYHHHWCPGDQWDNGWGPNPNWNNCRDWDDNYGGPAGYGPGYGPPPWAPPPPPPPPWAPWAQVTWNSGANGWGFWNNGIWVPI